MFELAVGYLKPPATAGGTDSAGLLQKIVALPIQHVVNGTIDLDSCPEPSLAPFVGPRGIIRRVQATLTQRPCGVGFEGVQRDGWFCDPDTRYGVDMINSGIRRV